MRDTSSLQYEKSKALDHHANHVRGGGLHTSKILWGPLTCAYLFTMFSLTVNTGGNQIPIRTYISENSEMLGGILGFCAGWDLRPS